MKPQISSRDLKLLSLYLDGQLSPVACQRLEKRLQENPALSLALAELQQTRKLLRSMPRVRSPRNFTLTPQMAGAQTSRAAYPALGFVSALASFLFILVVAIDLLGLFTQTSQLVALKEAPAREAVGPTAVSVQEQLVQIAPTATLLPLETKTVEDQMAMKAVAPEAERATQVLEGTQPPALTQSEMQGAETAAPAPANLYAKEAPPVDTGVSGEIGEPGATSSTEVLEMEFPAMATPTDQFMAKAALPSALPAEEKLPEETAVAGNLPEPEGLIPSPSIGEEQPRVEVSTIDQERLAEREGVVVRTPGRVILWVIEGLLAGTALVAGSLFIRQRRKTVR